ncbi:dUTP diphosphatase [Paenibacillus sp. SN-8-1]|uniref:dUTP diphosphatase n=1 Tax=Paenibacillus sp. SN-8-1 TaxID=3435409 RepID=UPI003D9A545E
MNLTKLFEMQRELDERIVKEKGLEGRDLLPEKILALQVELGECANEWRGFKFWSEDQESRTMQYRKVLKRFLSRDEYISREQYNPLLEEYIDCLHFILSIGLIDDLYTYVGTFEPVTSDNITKIFNRIFGAVSYISEDFDAYEYQMLLEFFFGLGKMLGFTWEQIESAYKTKWEINQQRQSTGY